MKKTTPTIKLLINNTQIEQCGQNLKSKSINFLGVLVDSELNWNEHITYTKNNIVKIIAMLSQIKKTYPLDLKIMMFKSLLMPHLNYCLPIFGHSKQTSTLFKCQKWALRTITRSNRKSHTNRIFRKYNILKLNELYELSICMLIRKRIENQGPTLLQDIYNYKNMRNTHYITTN